MVVNNDGGKGGGGITSPPHPRQVLSAHFIYFPARDLFNGFLARPLETLRDAPSFSLMLLLLFKRSDCMHKVLTCIYVVNTSWANCKKLHVALLTSWPHDLYCHRTAENCLLTPKKKLIWLPTSKKKLIPLQPSSRRLSIGMTRHLMMQCQHKGGL